MSSALSSRPARSAVSGPTTRMRTSGCAPSPARSARVTMGIPATVCNGLGINDRMRVPAPAASTTRATRSSSRGEIPTALVWFLSSSGGKQQHHGDAAGGPGFEPGTKVPKTLVIPFHHPPTEGTDPTGTLTRGWCLPSPEGVYQRLVSVLVVKRLIVRPVGTAFFPQRTDAWD